MRTFLVVAFLGMTALLASADVCFNHPLIQEKWLPMKEACKAEITETDEVMRMRLLTKCLVKKQGWLSDDGIFDYDAFKAASESMIIHKSDEIMGIMDTCWTDASDGATKLAEFFGCYKPKIDAICSDSLKWEDN